MPATLQTRLKNLKELLEDSKKCPRLSEWENGFLARMRELVARSPEEMPMLSEAQQTTLDKIAEEKVYAT